MPKAIRDFLGMSFFFWSNEQSGNALEPIHIYMSELAPGSDRKGERGSEATEAQMRTRIKAQVRRKISHLLGGKRSNRTTTLPGWCSVFAQRQP